MRTTHMLIATLLTLSLGYSSTAQTYSDRLFSSPPAVPAAESSKPDVLSNEALKGMIELLGFDVRTRKIGTSEVYFVFITSGGLKFDVCIELSQNHEKVWLSTSLDVVSVDQKNKLDHLVRLLELNIDAGPNFFRYNSKNNQISIARAFDNRKVTPKILKDNLERLIQCSLENKSHWMTSNWDANQPTPFKTETVIK